jgi:hypothetical protein
MNHDVGVLTQRTPQRAVEGLRVEANLALCMSRSVPSKRTSRTEFVVTSRSVPSMSMTVLKNGSSLP